MTQENVFGIPMHIQRRADLEDEAQRGDPVYYLVLRCADAPAHTFPESLRRRNIITPCQQCHESCWLDPNSYILGSVIRCIRCRPEKSRNCTTNETLAEIRKLIQEGGHEAV